MKATKIILPIALVLFALAAIFFLAPLDEFKREEESLRERQATMYTIQAVQTQPWWKKYLQFCIAYWRTKFTGTYDGGTLPEIKVTP